MTHPATRRSPDRPHPANVREIDLPCHGGSPGSPGRGHDREIDRLIARRAGEQHGLVTRRELLAAGVGRGALDHRVAAGRLHVVHPGVYAVGHRAPAPFAREHAAVLACGPDAALSHDSATVLLTLLPDRGGPVHVTRTGSHRPGPAGVRVHTTGALDVITHDGIPVTSPARTLLDLAATGSAHELERAVEQALVLRLVTRGELRAATEARRPGAARLRRALGAEPTLTRSEAERRFLALLARAGLPTPETNVRLGRYEVDVLWPEHRLVVEIDGYAYHSTRAAFERDRIRDADLQAAGHRVLRVTWRQLTEQPESLVARLAVALAAPALRLAS